jgi:type II secretory pathway pseudopilin PulG
MESKTRARKAAKGMTLLEMTVVILVLIALITTLFAGARAWVRGSNRSTCVINIRLVQQAVRSHQNINALSVGASLDIPGNLTGPDKFIQATSVCPAGGTYTYATTIPPLGTLAMTCSLAVSEEHVPMGYAGW